MQEYVLETENLAVRFGGRSVLEDVSVQVPRGKCIAIIGEEKGGKTSFLHLLSGHLKPNFGLILYNGSEISTLDPLLRIRLGIGSSFWQGAFEPRLSLLENVKWAVQNTVGVRYQLIRHYKPYNDSEQKAYEYLQQVGLDGKYARLAGSLNEGEMRRLELAITMAFDPELMLLDEPTAGMGEEETEEIVEIIRGIKKIGDKSILMVEKRKGVIQDLSDGVLVLSQGRIAAEGTPEEMVEQPSFL